MSPLLIEAHIFRRELSSHQVKFARLPAFATAYKRPFSDSSDVKRGNMVTVSRNLALLFFGNNTLHKFQRWQKRASDRLDYEKAFAVSHVDKIGRRHGCRAPGRIECGHVFEYIEYLPKSTRCSTVALYRGLKNVPQV